MPVLAQQVTPLRFRPALDGVGRGLGDGIAAAAVGRAAGTAQLVVGDGDAGLLYAVHTDGLAGEAAAGIVALDLYV